MSATRSRTQARARRHRRVRIKVRGTPERPRLSVFRSNRHVMAQVVDDRAGRTLASASTMEPEVARRDDKSDGPGGKVGEAAAVGRLIAERARAAGVTRVVFDRGGFLYHGRVAAVAEGARHAGLEL